MIEFSEDQARSRIVYDDGFVSTKCDQCRAAYAERIPLEEPPCHTCYVELMPENNEAMEVYMMVRSQYITAGMGQVVDVSIPAVKIVMDLLGVHDQLKCLNKVRATFHHFLKKDKKEE